MYIHENQLHEQLRLEKSVLGHIGAFGSERVKGHLTS